MTIVEVNIHEILARHTPDISLCLGHRWATGDDRWKSPHVTVSNDDNEVKVIQPTTAHWTAAFCADSLAEAGSSWCFRCVDSKGIWFGLALRDSVPRWSLDASPKAKDLGLKGGAVKNVFDVPWSDVIAVSVGNLVGYVSCSPVVRGKDAADAAYSLHSKTVCLNMQVRDGSLFLRVNNGPTLEIARGLGALSRWTPYVSFSSVSKSSSGVKIE